MIMSGLSRMGLPPVSSLRRWASLAFRWKFSPLTRLSETPPLAPVEDDECAFGEPVGHIVLDMVTTSPVSRLGFATE
jgi:hypothetical protein